MIPFSYKLCNHLNVSSYHLIDLVNYIPWTFSSIGISILLLSICPVMLVEVNKKTVSLSRRSLWQVLEEQAIFYWIFVVYFIGFVIGAMAYNEEQIHTLLILNVIASTFSFLGASFIIANYIAFDEFKSNFAFKLILFVAIGDVINSVGNFLGTPSDGSGLCYIQAFLTQFGDIVSFAWVTAIAWIIYTILSREVPPTRQDVEKWYKKIHLVIWPTTLFLSILPFITSSYGKDNALLRSNIYIFCRMSLDIFTISCDFACYLWKYIQLLDQSGSWWGLGRCLENNLLLYSIMG